MASDSITTLLAAWSQGDSRAHEELFRCLYPDLRKIAGRRLNAISDPLTLNTADLVNESYLRLVDQRVINWQNRNHFFAMAARVIRRVLLDHLKHRSRAKRGDGAEEVPLRDVTIATGGTNIDLLALDQALERLEAIDPQAARVVELRYFTGLNHDETAQALDIGRATVGRKWRFARAFLRRNFNISSD